MASATAKRYVALLAFCQAMSNTTVTVLVAVSALVGAMLAEDKALATVPHGMQWLATMAMSVPASLFMRRVGRRIGFMSGATLGIAGALVCAQAILIGSFWLYAAGTVLIGAFNSFAMFYRFAAAEAADVDFRPKAIALVIGGGVAAAFIGPELAKQTKDLLLPHEFAGTFVALTAIPILLLATVSFVDIPTPTAAERAGPQRPLLAIARQPKFVVAALCGMIGWGGMVLVMTATPLSMVGHGHVFSDAAFVVQWHIFAMYAPSFVTGTLIRRFGLYTVLAAGVVLYVGSVAAGLSGMTVATFWLTNFLIGLGWNFLYVGGTNLLTETYTPAERGKIEGFNDFLVFGATTTAVFISGWMQHVMGWAAINYALLPLIVLVAAALLWLRLTEATPAAAE